MQVLPELKKALPAQFGNVELPSQAKQNGAAAAQGAPAEAKDASAAGTDAATKANKDPKDSRENLVRVFLWRPSNDVLACRSRALMRRSLLQSTSRPRCWSAFSFPARGSSIKSGASWRRDSILTNGATFTSDLPFSIGLFLTGAALAFFVVFQPVLKFLFSFNRLDGHRPGAANQRMARLRFDSSGGFWAWLPVAFGDVVLGADRRDHHTGLFEAVEDCRVGDFRVGGVAYASRSEQYDVVGAPADRPLFRRHPLVQADAAKELLVRVDDDELGGNKLSVSNVLLTLRVIENVTRSVTSTILLLAKPTSDRFATALAGADADAVFQRKDEDFAVADLAGRTGPPTLDDRVDRRLQNSSFTAIIN